MSYDPAIQARALQDVIARARTVANKFNWGEGGNRAELEESFKSMVETAEGMSHLPAEVAAEMQASAYSCVTALNDFCEDLEMVMERVPGLRKGGS